MKSVAPIVYIFAPRACGKTRNKEQLMQMFGCTNIVDDWDGRSHVPEGSLVLTSLEVPHFR